MKRIGLICLVLFVSKTLMSQTEFDAKRIIETDIIGSARYMSMAGAFGALGGDPTAIKDNPAGLGIFRGSEISMGFNFLNQRTTATWGTNSANSNMQKLGFNNLSYVLSSPASTNAQRLTGLVRSNWSFNYNRLRNFNREVRINGVANQSSVTDYMAYFTGNSSGASLFETNNYDPFNNPSVSWISVLAANAGLMNEYVDNNTGVTQYWQSLLNNNEQVTPSYRITESGFYDTYSFSWAGNFNNRLFVGGTLNIHDKVYNANSNYAEIFGEGGNMNLYNVFRSNANGFNVNVGLIYIPVDFIRVGASLKTPMTLRVRDVHFADLAYNYGSNNSGTISTPTGDNTYRLRIPPTYSLSAAVLLGDKGVVGIEYMVNNHSGTRLMNTNNELYPFRYENDSIQTLFNNQGTLKLGAEYRLTDQISIRAGYAVSDPMTNSRIAKEMIPNSIRTDVEYFVHNSTQYLTFGVGYREANWYFDLGVLNKVVDSSFYAFNSNRLSANLAQRPASVITNNATLVATLGFRF